MTQSLYKKGGKRKYRGYACLKLDCAEDRVDELIAAGWARTPHGAHRPVPPPSPPVSARKKYSAPKKKILSED